MSRLQLIDTSVWVHALQRKGDHALRQQVIELTANGRGAWCDPIRLELWRGVNSPYDREVLTAMELDIPKLPVDETTWTFASQLADVGRAKGFQFPSPDLLIFSCAKQYDVPLIHRDAHFPTLEQLWTLIPITDRRN